MMGAAGRFVCNESLQALDFEAEGHNERELTAADQGALAALELALFGLACGKSPLLKAIPTSDLVLGLQTL